MEAIMTFCFNISRKRLELWIELIATTETNLKLMKNAFAPAYRDGTIHKSHSCWE